MFFPKRIHPPGSAKKVNWLHVHACNSEKSLAAQTYIFLFYRFNLQSHKYYKWERKFIIAANPTACN